MEYTSRVADKSDEAHVNYQCPCGCTAGLMYSRESGSMHLGACCCGRLLWVGDDAEAIVRAKSVSGVHYELDVSSVTLPWGETKTAALAVPTMREKPDLEHDHEGHDHPHPHEEHDHDGHSHPHDEHSHEHQHDEHGHDHDHEGHGHNHEHDHNAHEHHEHEHHDDGHIHVHAPTRVRDVVCGMMIEPASAAGSSFYKGETYYFCALNCKQKFDANPSQYVKPKGLLARLFGRS